MIRNIGWGFVIPVVDEDEAVRKVARIMLERLGYTVLDAANGAKALTLCEALGENPDLIISDIRMPQVGGGELVCELERNGERPSVLLMSGHADEALRAQVEIGAYPFLKKPFTLADLDGGVRAALGIPEY